MLVIDHDVVRLSLKYIRQARSIQSNPLNDLVWIRHQIGSAVPLPSSAGYEIVLRDSLTSIIIDNLNRLRQLEQLPAAQMDTNREESLAELLRDFQSANKQLGIWSALYFRFVRTDLDLQMQHLAHIVSMHPRQFRRYLNSGYRHLASIISTREQQARQEHWSLWLQMKLPAPTYPYLRGRRDDLNALDWRIKTDRGITLLTGLAGSGKTALAHALTQHLIDHNAIDDIAWITLDHPIDYSHLLDQLGNELGLPHLSQFNDLQGIETYLRQHMHFRRTLLVLDGARHLDEPAPLLEALFGLIGEGHILLTSRHLINLTVPSLIYHLDPIAQSDYHKLLYDYLRKRRIRQQQNLTHEVTRKIYTSIDGHPLAGRLIVDQMAYLPVDQALQDINQLTLPDGTPLYEYMFANSWSTLSKDAKRVAHRIAEAMPMSSTWATISQQVDMKHHQCASALQELITRCLLRRTDNRYVMSILYKKFIDTLIVPM